MDKRCYIINSISELSRFKYEKDNLKPNYDNSFLNTENSFKKFNTNKKFFRAITTNYDINKPKNLEATNQNPEKFKLLLKAQENLKKKILEKQNPKKDNVSGQTIENKLNQQIKKLLKYGFNNKIKSLE